MSTFAQLGVHGRTLERLSSQNINEPLPVQAEAIPPQMAGKDVVIASPTGSGKTLAYLLPMLERISNSYAKGRALVVVPTRELATQINGVLGGVDSRIKSALVYGGVGYGNQIKQLKDADVIIACPGRLLDLQQSGSADLSQVMYLVLDEADEMFQRGFARDVDKIIELTKRSHKPQITLASATMPVWVRNTIARHLVSPVNITVAAPEESTLEHGLFRVQHNEKVSDLHKLLGKHQGSVIVFHRTKHGTTRLRKELAQLGHSVVELQGNLSQNARDRALKSFRDRKSRVLVATNVAARGLDVEDVALVVNYELPDEPQWLTHRVGRTARNGASGRALTFLADDEMLEWRKLRTLGAPDLQLVDRERLLASGEMAFTEEKIAPISRTSMRRTFKPRGRRFGR